VLHGMSWHDLIDLAGGLPHCLPSVV
jgi:hypothetical protein